MFFSPFSLHVYVTWYYLFTFKIPSLIEICLFFIISFHFFLLIQSTAPTFPVHIIQCYLFHFETFLFYETPMFSFIFPVYVAQSSVSLFFLCKLCKLLTYRLGCACLRRNSLYSPHREAFAGMT